MYSHNKVGNVGGLVLEAAHNWKRRGGVMVENRQFTLYRNLESLKEAFVQTFGVYILINITVHDKKPAIVE